MKIRWEAPASAKGPKKTRTERHAGAQSRATIAITRIDILPGLSRSLPCRPFTLQSTVLGWSLTFWFVFFFFLGASALAERTLTILKGLCNMSVGVINALYNRILHTAPGMSMHYLRNHPLLSVGADVFDGYCFIRHRLSVSSNHLCLGGSDACFNAALPLHAFCTQVQVNFRNGTDPAPSLSHFLLQCEEIFKTRTNIVNNSSAWGTALGHRPHTTTGLPGSSEAMSTSIPKLNNHLGETGNWLSCGGRCRNHTGIQRNREVGGGRCRRM